MPRSNVHQTGDTVESPGRPLQKAFALLETVGQSSQAPSLSALSRLTGIPKASVHRMLRVLSNLDLVLRRDDGTYTLGDRLFDMVDDTERSAVERLRLLLSPYLMELRDRTGAVVALGQLSGHNIRVLDTLYSHHQSGYVRPGNHLLPVHCTALGRTLIARHLDVFDPTRTPPFTRFTPHTTTDPRVLARILHTVCRLGHAVVENEYLPGVVSVAAPIELGFAAPDLAICAFGPMPLRNKATFINAVKDVAAAAGDRLGPRASFCRPSSVAGSGA
ncbi:IclR family transcriptional regulator [Amycolatopsis sp. Hca4]|uniref:IclR family transcriptional regulator n=1 Tax=Amycolatopsis sp. Hca4 TaxID=2742131 RepID=UPI0015905B0C|nr:helix-turn-helix domain-containing protein [Amycolatopsis sp. Hca4]QKV74029.1 helix-turn-helix domain-containing protein [Amycolatopsis sp. Hca4]